MRSQNAEHPSQGAQPAETVDIHEKGAPINCVRQVSKRRLFLQLQVFGECPQPQELINPLRASGREVVLYQDLNDPYGVGVLFITEDASELATEVRTLLVSPPFASLRRKPEFTMTGRTYSSGYEPDLEDWLLAKPRRNALTPEFPWAIWYPLRRKPEFYLLSESDQGQILREHAMIGRSYAEAGYARDIRLACFGLDQHDNDFVIGLMGPELYPLSRLVQEMRKTQQTAKYLESLGPFFIGKVCWQSPLPD